MSKELEIKCIKIDFNICIIAIPGCTSQNNNYYNTNSILSYNYSSNTLSTVNNSSKTKNYETSGNYPFVWMEILCRFRIRLLE